MVHFNSLLLLTLLTFASAKNVISIDECPKLTKRTKDSQDVTDLRIDDIQVIAALGDSIMAGFGMMGINNNPLEFGVIKEYRGNSHAIGGDTGAVTLANFVKHYNPNLKGAAVLSHSATLCYGPICNAPLNMYRPWLDNNNAAQSGAMSVDLDYELDYLIAHMKTQLGSNYSNVWKLITLQVGSNDQCASCNTLFSKYTTSESYGKNVEAAVERIKKEIPKVVINLLGAFKVSPVFPLTETQQSYCKPDLIRNNKLECSCSSSSSNLSSMDTVSEGYNKQLDKIAAKYKGKTGDTFAVMYSPPEIDISSFPIEAFSTYDCFHPSLKGHQWIAKTYWNQMFLKQSKKPSVMKFDANLKIRCPTDDDRLPTTD